MKQAFTLIELLVVVLIIGILAAIALPQYQKAVERAKIAEAVTNLRAIANANQVYYMTNGVYAEKEDMDKLDVTISGEILDSQSRKNRIKTKYFTYSPNGEESRDFSALAWENNNAYFLYIQRENPTVIKCGFDSEKGNDIQKKLCAQINTNGSL